MSFRTGENLKSFVFTEQHISFLILNIKGLLQTPISSVHSFIRLLFCSLVRSFAIPSVRSLFRSFVRFFARSFDCSFPDLFLYSLFVRSFFCLSIWRPQHPKGAKAKSTLGFSSIDASNIKCSQVT